MEEIHHRILPQFHLVLAPSEIPFCKFWTLPTIHGIQQDTEIIELFQICSAKSIMDDRMIRAIVIEDARNE